MLFSRKNILTRGKRPLYAATRVLNASSATASSALAKCWVHGTNKTSALFRSVKNQSRAYSTGKSMPDDSNSFENSALEKGLLLYQKFIDASTKWYPIPIAVGALVLVVIQYRRKRRDSKRIELDDDGVEVIKLKGPWQVHVMGALPLRNMSRLWGYINSFELPVWFRPYGFRAYALAFGCDLNEIEPSDLREYASMGDFFYRGLKPGARPVDDAILVSPADGTILHFGTIQDFHIEQVKGITYSLDALLGIERPGTPTSVAIPHHHNMPVIDHHEFANVNGIEYTLDQLLGASSPTTPSSSDAPTIDASVGETNIVHDASVALELGLKPRRLSGTQVRPGNSLYFTVIYLAPGDYHRFHSPTAWVVEKRRHFPGELFSVAPWMAKRLENLFVLNERVALLGRWRHGFFGMVPVGATNVGSIRVNFDQALRTNIKMRRRERAETPPGSYSEAVYSAASPILNGQPLLPAQEMGGFCLGSTIVLVFEAPDDFEFSIQADQKVKVGQMLGDLTRAT